MLDLQFICDNRDDVEKNCEARGITADVGALLTLREERNKLNQAGDDLRRQQNETSAKIPKASAEERPALIEQGKEFKQQISENEAQQKDVEAKLRKIQRFALMAAL